MKQNKDKSTLHLKRLTLVALTATILFSSCQKELSPDVTSTLLKQSQKINLPETVNPYSLRNVQKAQETLSSNSASRSTTSTNGSDMPQYVYFKFSPSELTEDQFLALENDSTVKLLDFPFANAALYNEDFALDETKKEQLTDGSIYGVTNIENTAALNLIKNSSLLQTTFLDTLALIPEEDTTLQYQAFREAGGTETQIARLRICLFKRPSGFVRYRDNELQNPNGSFGRLEPVRNMQVWGLVFGIPLWTHTDGNGYYRFPWRFSAGTIMGTHAKNSRVNVKPFNTMGPWYQVVPQLIVNFIVGSVHVKGWVSSCDMRSDVNFDFNDHRQNKYWSQILNAYYFHDQYAAQDGINNSPQDMICYAHWADAPDFGSASTPMIHQMLDNTFTGQFLVNFFNGNPVTGTLLRLCQALGPDMTFKVCGGTEPQNYNSRLAQTAFHELGHASMYRAVGAGWHLKLALAELTHTYGNPGYNNWGKVQVGESWAEFIGTDNALRRYTTGVKNSEMLGFPTLFSTALESEDWFAEPTRWIPNGVYFDLKDVVNTEPLENPWDDIGGSNNSQLYSIFSSRIDNMCDYREQFISNFPQYDQTRVRNLFNHYNLNCK